MRFHNLKAEVPEEKVLQKMNCPPESEWYEEFQSELEELESEAKRALDPHGAMAFGKIPKELATKKIPEGTEVACAIITIGKDISDYCESFFRDGDCVRGLLADSYADIYLFELEKCWVHQVMDVCRERKVGIRGRLEIPGDLTMEAQKFAFDTIGEAELPGLTLSRGYMFYPVKTICHIFLLSEDPEEFWVAHDCRRCTNTACNMRKEPPSPELLEA